MKLTIKEMQNLAEKRDGQCLSKEYINAFTKLQWKCKKGHIWWATPHSIKNKKSWCPYCANHVLTIEELHQIAKSRDGKCLSNKYINNNIKLKWQCKEGHTWKALPSSIKHKNWCPYCAGKNKTIKDMNKIAKSRGGKCLSKEYINDRKKLKWQCSEGHIWYSAPINIRNKGTWCSICSSGLKERICRSYFEFMFKEDFSTISPNWLDNSWHIDGYCKKLNLAFEYNGIQHYKPICFGEYSKEKAKLNLKNQQIRDKEKLQLCKENNVILIVIPYTVKRKDIQQYIIQECEKRNINIPNKKIVDYKNLKKIYLNDKLNEMKLLAESRNGKCLSKIYINQNTKLQWQCDKGHTWWAVPSSIKHANRWCPYCAGCARSTIEEMQELAKSRGGKCLSNKYINSRTKLQWQCNKGHTWFSVPSSIKNGTWCPYCAKNVKQTIEDMQKLAESKDGKCLSKEYINNSTKLTWQCEKGHIWNTKPYHVKSGHWCPICSRRKSNKHC